MAAPNIADLREVFGSFFKEEGKDARLMKDVFDRLEAQQREEEKKREREDEELREALLRKEALRHAYKEAQKSVNAAQMRVTVLTELLEEAQQSVNAAQMRVTVLTELLEEAQQSFKQARKASRDAELLLGSAHCALDTIKCQWPEPL